MSELSKVYKTDLSDRDLMRFWAMMQAAGRDRAVSYCMPPQSGEDFCAWMRKPEVHPWIVFFEGAPVGFYFLTDYEGKTAQIHFGTLPQRTKRLKKSRIGVTRAFGCYAVASCLHEHTVSGGYRLDTLLGLTPLCNRDACRFILRCGATICGEIPAACYFYDTQENVAGLATAYTRETVPAEWARL